MQKHNIEHSSGSSSRPSRRVGRGGKRGKTSGRGMKGAGARAGNKGRPEMRDIIKKIPKRRGYGKNRARTVVAGRDRMVVNLAALEKMCTAGDTVTPKMLVDLKLVRRIGGKAPKIKILGQGTLTKKLVLSGLEVSDSAREAVIKVGGEVQ